MMDCTFCKIVKGELPCYKVYEDNLFYAFLDHKPGTLGHTLIIPKKHYRWVYDVPEFTQYWLTVLKVTKAIQRALNPVFVTYLTYGLKVNHAHIHILPRGPETEEEVAPSQKTTDTKQLSEIAKKISSQLIADFS